MNTGRTTLDIAWRLNATLVALDISQAELARRCGFEPPKVNNWIKGTASPRLDAAHIICDKLRLTLDWIYRGDESNLSGDMQAALAKAGNALPVFGQTTAKKRGRRAA